MDLMDFHLLASSSLTRIQKALQLPFKHHPLQPPCHLQLQLKNHKLLQLAIHHSSSIDNPLPTTFHRLLSTIPPTAATQKPQTAATWQGPPRATYDKPLSLLSTNHFLLPSMQHHLMIQTCIHLQIHTCNLHLVAPTSCLRRRK